MSDDIEIVRESLRLFASQYENVDPSKEARAALERIASDLINLRKVMEETERVLEPFAKEADSFEPYKKDDSYEAWDVDLTIGDLRRARTAYARIRSSRSDT